MSRFQEAAREWFRAQAAARRLEQQLEHAGTFRNPSAAENPPTLGDVMEASARLLAAGKRVRFNGGGLAALDGALDDYATPFLNLYKARKLLADGFDGFDSPFVPVTLTIPTNSLTVQVQGQADGRMYRDDAPSQADKPALSRFTGPRRRQQRAYAEKCRAFRWWYTRAL